MRARRFVVPFQGDGLNRLSSPGRWPGLTCSAPSGHHAQFQKAPARDACIVPRLRFGLTRDASNWTTRSIYGVASQGPRKLAEGAPGAVAFGLGQLLGAIGVASLLI